MKKKEWSKETRYYRLSADFSIVRVEPDNFFIHWAVYSGDTTTHTWDLQIKEFDSLSEYKLNCYWIQKAKGNQRIGGVVIAPNRIACFFTEPPFQDSFLVIKLLRLILVAWSDFNEPIYAIHISEKYLNHFLRLGFEVVQKRRWMLRPTEKFNVKYSSKFILRNPTLSDEKSLSDLSYFAYRDSLDDRFYEKRTGEKFTLELALEGINNYLEGKGEHKPMLSSSWVVINKKEEIIAACLISKWEEWPLVYDLVVHPQYQGRGLGTKLLKNVLSVLNPNYPVLRLFVTLGNPSESIYYSLGFMPGPDLPVLELRYRIPKSPKSE